MFRRRLATRAPAAVSLVPLMVASVFVSEGIQNFLSTWQLGAGRFAAIGFMNRAP